MDDDDYYFPDRISYSIRQLTRHRGKYLLAGCNTALVYFPLALQKSSSRDQLVATDRLFRVFSTEQLYRSPTVGNVHHLPGNICNGSMCYHVSYLSNHSYLDTAVSGEEKQFTNQYREAVLQLPSERILICIAHGSNTVEKYAMVSLFTPTLLQAPALIEHPECLRFYRGGSDEPQCIPLEEYNTSKPPSASAFTSTSFPSFRSKRSRGGGDSGGGATDGL